MSSFSSQNKPPFLDLETSSGQDHLQKLLALHDSTVLNFESLTLALKTTERSEALAGALKLSPDAAVQLDEAETEHLKGEITLITVI